jgi:two-component system nitrogen regulation response regulator NtrX
MCALSAPAAARWQELAENPNQDGKLLATLAAFTVGIPPLRSQPDDIVFLVNQIVTELAETQKIPLVKFSTAALNIMRQYDWPGNLDQLRSIVKNLALTADNDEVGEQAVNNILGQFTPNTNTEIVGGFNFNMPLRELREELERRYFEYHIAQEGQNMSRVAQKVGLERTHLYRKLKQLGINFSRRQGSDKNGEE